MTREIVDIKCPDCGRWLSETRDYGRSVCPNCGWEVTVRSKKERAVVLTTPHNGTDTNRRLVTE